MSKRIVYLNNKTEKTSFLRSSLVFLFDVMQSNQNGNNLNLFMEQKLILQPRIALNYTSLTKKNQSIKSITYLI